MQMDKQRKNGVDLAGVLKMRRSGARVQDIAERFQCSAQYVYVLVRRYGDLYGIETDCRAHNGRRKGAVYDPEEIKRLRKGGMSQDEISRKLGCSTGYVSNVINHKGRFGQVASVRKEQDT